MNDFINEVKQISKNKNLVNELENIELNLLKKIQPDIGEEFVVGCEYRKGVFISDPDGNVIYRRQSPLFYSFLKDWYFIDKLT